MNSFVLLLNTQRFLTYALRNTLRNARSKQFARLDHFEMKFFNSLNKTGKLIRLSWLALFSKLKALFDPSKSQ